MNKAIALVDRPPTSKEMKRLRLILSTFQDGSGMLKERHGTLPGWRDFERAVALAFDGENQENKAIFDVLIRDTARPRVRFGISCKMRRELDRVERDGRVTIELSNSQKKFWAYLKTNGINEANYKDSPSKVGHLLIELVRQWHEEVSLEQGGIVDIGKSSYLSLQWNRAGWYQLYWFKLTLPEPSSLRWYFPKKRRRNGEVVVADHLNGNDKEGTVFEWYGESGGQLKYYPLANAARWQSGRFKLEPLPKGDHGILARVKAYFPSLWPK